MFSRSPTQEEMASDTPRNTGLRAENPSHRTSPACILQNNQFCIANSLRNVARKSDRMDTCGLTSAQHGNKAALVSLMHNKAAGYVHISFGELEADTNLQQDPWQKREEN